MPSSSRPDRRSRGFTLVEVTIAMFILVIVLVLSGTLLVSMRSFAQKQQAFAEPRQTARRAIDYLAYYVRGASDMNFAQSATPVPDAIVTWYQLAGTSIQASFDNVSAGSNLALPGTDIITLAKPSPGSFGVQISQWSGGTSTATAANFYVDYAQGCAQGDSQNMLDFQQLVGYNPTTGTSNVFLIQDYTGQWQYYQITNFLKSNCADANSPPQIIHVGANPGKSSEIDPPGGFHTLQCGSNAARPCNLAAGMQFLTFRVANDATTGIPRLEEFNSSRLFNSNSDFTGASDPFTPLLDNVEDLQVAYIFSNGDIWNTSQQTLPAGTYQGSVPSQASANQYDVQNVVGLRISVVARSASLIPTFLGGPGSKVPAVTPPENSAATYAAGYYHYRLTATVMIQNRILGN
ncbi:MAG: prepilin-type N-terminal cleavage/methylation domain-containing protein [Acidobacteriota bacterium]